MKYTTIRNEDDLRIAWSNLQMIAELEQNHPSVNGNADELKASIKREIRRYYKEQASKPEHRYFDSNMDGYWMFIETPYPTVEDANELFVPLFCYPYQLGRMFDSCWKFFKRSDGTVCMYIRRLMNW